MMGQLRDALESEISRNVITGLIHSWIWDGLESRGLPYKGLTVHVSVNFDDGTFECRLIWGAEVNPLKNGNQIDLFHRVSITEYEQITHGSDFWILQGRGMGQKIDECLHKEMKGIDGEFEQHLNNFRIYVLMGAESMITGEEGFDCEITDLTGTFEGGEQSALMKVYVEWPMSVNGFADLATIRYVTRSQMVQAESVYQMFADIGANCRQQLREAVER